MEIVSYLLDDHNVIRQYLKELNSQAASPARKKKVINELIVAVEAHVRAEEATLYSYLKHCEAKGHRLFALTGKDEHELIVRLSHKIKKTLNQELRDARISMLSEILEKHLRHEEKNILPEFKKLIPDNHAETLAEEFLELRKQLPPMEPVEKQAI